MKTLILILLSINFCFGQEMVEKVDCRRLEPIPYKQTDTSLNTSDQNELKIDNKETFVKIYSPFVSAKEKITILLITTPTPCNRKFPENVWNPCPKIVAHTDYQITPVNADECYKIIPPNSVEKILIQVGANSNKYKLKVKEMSANKVYYLYVPSTESTNNTLGFLVWN
ncbi:MAG: hypothetical protein ABI851_02735 [Saprospiraceae bacterium]